MGVCPTCRGTQTVPAGSADPSVEVPCPKLDWDPAHARAACRLPDGSFDQTPYGWAPAPEHRGARAS